MMRNALFIIISIVQISCSSNNTKNYEQNYSKNDIINGNFTYSYNPMYNIHDFLNILLDIKGYEKWEIFYEDNSFIYFGLLKNDNIVLKLNKIEKNL